MCGVFDADRTLLDFQEFRSKVMRKVITRMAGFSKNDLVSKANEVVSIYDVCTKAGVDFSSYMGSRSKLYCPFGGITHMDGGATRAFRIYEETNTAYCFACSQVYDPVGLYCAITDLNRMDAAEALLEEAGWREETFEEKWDRLSGNDDQAFDNTYLPEALANFCSRLDPDWVTRQLEEPYSSALARCIAISRRVETPEQAAAWLDTSKAFMKGLLDA